MPARTVDPRTDAGFAEAVLRHGLSRAQLYGITTEELEAIYFLASEDFAAGRYPDALDRTAFLAQQDPWQQRYVHAFALALQCVGDFEMAARFFAQALAMDATDASSALRIGECLLATGEVADAREALDTAIRLSWLDPGHEEIRASARRALAHLDASGAA